MSESILCKLCKTKPATNMQLDMEQFGSATEVLQLLFEVFEIREAVSQLCYKICDYCRAEVLNMCGTLRCWRQAHNQTNVTVQIKQEAQYEEEELEIEEATEPLDDNDYKLFNTEIDLSDEEQQQAESVLGTETFALHEGSFAIAIAYDASLLGQVVKLNEQANDIQLMCNYCNERFPSASQLQRHSSTHVQRIYVCRQCGAQFNSGAFLQQHEYAQQHTNVPKGNARTVDFRCQQCGRLFERFYCLCRHEREVHRSAAHYYKCATCGEGFKYKAIYDKHVNQHLGITEQKPLLFHCEHCGKSFARRFQLKTHLRVHTGEQPHVCDACGKCFAHRGNLMLHKRSLHEGERRFECEVCLARFATTTHLKNHRVQHEKKGRVKLEQPEQVYLVTYDQQDDIVLESMTGSEPNADNL